MSPQICEIYSPPRIVPVGRGKGFSDGWSLDMSTCDRNGEPWNFDDAACRQRAKQLVIDTKPLLLVLSPMCRFFSQLQNLSKNTRDQENFEKNRRIAVQHLNFCIELCKLQEESGRYYLLEQPAGATSWKEPKMLEFL